MDKENIKIKLRESLFDLYEEKDDEAKKPDDADNQDNKSAYPDVTNFFNNNDAINQVGIFRLAGFSEEQIYQKIPYKKLNQTPNNEGSFYSFNEEELARIRAAIDKYS